MPRRSGLWLSTGRRYHRPLVLIHIPKVADHSRRQERHFLQNQLLGRRTCPRYSLPLRHFQIKPPRRKPHHSEMTRLPQQKPTRSHPATWSRISPQKYSNPSAPPKQCGRCRSFDHQVRYCPKRDPYSKQRDLSQKQQEEGSQAAAVIPEPVNTVEEDFSQDRNHIRVVQAAQTDKQTPPSTVSPLPGDTPVRQEPSRMEINNIPTPNIETQAPQHPNSPAHCTPREKGSPPPTVEHKQDLSANPNLQADDINFPKLSTPARTLTQETIPPISTPTSHFIWRARTSAEQTPTTKTDRGKNKVSESAPITRQGYRTGRLAEDFWSALGMPHTPQSNPKMLKVIPFLTKDRQTEKAEYLVDKSTKPHKAIAHVQVAELLAGIPWTTIRARQHVVDEVSQSLHKLLIFNNNLSNPFQNWNQGRWYSHWARGPEGDHICTLFVCVAVTEQKVKPRKGKNLGWRRVSPEIQSSLRANETEEIQTISEDHAQWQEMAGHLSKSHTTPQAPPESHNRFAALIEEEPSSA